MRQNPTIRGSPWTGVNQGLCSIVFVDGEVFSLAFLAHEGNIG